MSGLRFGVSGSAGAHSPVVALGHRVDEDKHYTATALDTAADGLPLRDPASVGELVAVGAGREVGP